MRPVINIDCDNVLSDFSDEIDAAGFWAMGRTPSVQERQWDIPTQWGVSPGAYKRIFRQGVANDRIWRHSKPLPGALEAMWELSDAEYHIRILTHRLNHGFDFRKAVDSTAAWLDDNHIPYRSLAVIGDEPKSNYKALALVDDAPHNIEDWVENTDAFGVVFDQPWNQEVAKGPQVARALDWPHAVRLIRGALGQ